MNQVRSWIVLIGAAPEAAQVLAKTLQRVGYMYSWFSSPASFLASDYRFHPYCVVVDIDSEQLHQGLASIQCLVNAPWRWPTVVLNARGALPAAITMLQFQNFVFIQEAYSHSALLDAIRRSECFKPYRMPTGAVSTPTKLTHALSKLTPRELMITGEMLHGRSSKEIATKYAISDKTVEMHRSRVLQKMHVTSTLELMWLYLNNSAN